MDEAGPTDGRDETPGPPPRGSTASPVTAALLNLTGIGLGYGYLRRFWRWGLYLLVLLTLLIAAYRLEDDTVSWLWAGAGLAWIGASVWDASRLGPRGMASETPSPVLTVPAIVALALVVTELTGFWLYRSAGERALAAGRRAHRSGDCRTAVAHYDGVTDRYKMSFTSVVAAARTNRGECSELLAAQRARKRGAFRGAVGRYEAFLRAHPNTVLAVAVRDELADTEREWTDAYQQQLVQIAKRVRGSVGELRSLDVVPKLSRWFGTSYEEFFEIGDALSVVPPPPPVDDAHAQLEDALDLGTELATIRSAVDNYELCTAPAVLAALARESGRDLRLAQRSMRQAGLRLDLAVLWETRRTNRRVPNGHFVVPGNRSGSNSLTIKNAGPTDVVVALGSKPAMSVYVRAGDAYTISGIPSGSYPMYITGGRDWDAKRRTFTRSCEFKKLGNRANLTSDGFRYTIATLTLGSRDPGQQRVRSIAVAPEDFPGGPR